MAAHPRLIETAHGMWLEPALVPVRDAGALATPDRLLAPGPDARTRAGSLAASLAAGTGISPEFPHADPRERFGLEPVLEDLARTADRSTATFAQRRLEYRSGSLALAGPRLPWSALAMLSALAAAGAFSAAGLLRLLRRRPSPR